MFVQHVDMKASVETSWQHFTTYKESMKPELVFSQQCVVR